MSDTEGDEQLTIYSDYVCPFCYLGRHSLKQYEESREEPLELDWRPYDLRSGKRGPDGELDDSADDGKDEEYYAKAKENVRRLQERYDVEMNQVLVTDVDSLPAQVASFHVKEEHPERWREFDEAVFEALWTEGRDIGDPDVLADLAAAAGLDADEIRDAVGDQALRDRIEERFMAARKAGVTGVPTFAYEGYAARGAVPPEQLRRLVEGE